MPLTLRPRRWRAVLASALAGGTLLVSAEAALAAELRSPRLESSCETDYAYSEVRIGPFIVEGCNKRGTEQEGESARFLFKGKLEVNGLLVEPASGDDPVIGKIISGQDRNGRPVTNGRLDRNQSTRLVLDPRIGGQRRRIVIHTGAIHLEGSGNDIARRDLGYEPMIGGYVQVASLSRAERTSSIAGGGVVAKDAPAPAQRVEIGDTLGSTELPVGGVPALLGLRLFDLEDVRLGRDGMSFDVELKFGANAPGLMRDVLGRATVELQDGEGMKITDLQFKIGHIGIPGVGGMDHFRVNYDGARDEWSGGFDLDLGDLFPGIEFSAKVNASTGVPTEMNLSVAPLNIAVGPGIFLQGLRGGFDTSPLSFSAGATITAGPQIGGWSVITADGDVSIALEPNFRFEADGRVRVFPTGENSQLARGDINFVLDSSGLISLRGDARFDATAAGVGISASIRGDGAVSTSKNIFNIGASATGNLELGFLGSVQIAQLKAVVSSDGFGTCGKLFTFLSAGIGQKWKNGGLKVFTGCDLGPYRINVAKANRAERLQTGAGKVTPVVIRGDQKQAVLEVRADESGIPMRLIGPGGQVISTLTPGERKADADVVAMAAPAGSGGGEVMETVSMITAGRMPVALFALRNPKPGRYLIQTPASAPEIKAVGVAVDARPLEVQVQTGRTGKSGERRLRARARGLEPGDQLQFGFRTPGGVEPIGEPVGAAADLKFLELPQPGRRQILAQIVRDGIPVPGRVVAVGTHTAELPQVDGEVRARRRDQRLQVQARARSGGDRPDGFEYRITQNGKTGVFQQTASKALKVWLPDPEAQVKVEIHPIFRGVTIERVRKVIRVR